MRVLNFLNLIAQKLRTLLFLFLIDIQPVDFFLYTAELAVYAVILTVQILIFRKEIQKRQMPRRVHEVVAVVLPVNCNQPAAQFAHRRSGRRQSVDAEHTFPSAEISR